MGRRSTSSGERAASRRRGTAGNSRFARAECVEGLHRLEGTEMLLVEQQSPCPECGGQTEVDYSRGEAVCAECGLVTQDRLIDGSPEFVPDVVFVVSVS